MALRCPDLVDELEDVHAFTISIGGRHRALEVGPGRLDAPVIIGGDPTARRSL
jgi:hypothetical protein